MEITLCKTLYILHLSHLLAAYSKVGFHDLLFFHSEIAAQKIFDLGSSLLKFKVSYKSSKELPDQKISSNSISICLSCLNLTSLETIILHEYREAKINIIITDFTTRSALIKRANIEKSIFSQIIEPYFTTKVGGSGLGLAITKKIIDDHNGSIFIRPLRGSKGTSILLKFPLISK